jgi:hypothetical protein
MSFGGLMGRRAGFGSWFAQFNLKPWSFNSVREGAFSAFENLFA